MGSLKGEECSRENKQPPQKNNKGVYIVYLEQGFSKYDSEPQKSVVLLNIEMSFVFSLDSITVFVRWNFLDHVTYDIIQLITIQGYFKFVICNFK